MREIAVHHPNHGQTLSHRDKTCLTGKKVAHESFGTSDVKTFRMTSSYCNSGVAELEESQKVPKNRIFPDKLVK